MRRSPVLALTLALVCAMAISGTSVLAQAQTPVAQTGCGTGLKSFGPLNESGYPAHYVTQDDFILDHCDETTDDDPLCGNAPFGDPTGEGLPNGPVPDVATGNFWHETFYMLGNAQTDSCLLVLAVEGVWDNAAEAINDGDQLVFSRIRVRCDLTLPGEYLVTHPYGTDTFVVTAADIANTTGIRAINATDDCLHTVVDGVITPSCSVAGGDHFTNVFDDPADDTDPRISHALMWDVDAPAGYLGDPAVLHTVTGGSCGTNFFRVELVGPVPAADAPLASAALTGDNTNLSAKRDRYVTADGLAFFEETDQFIVMGRMGGIDCGDCDDGNPCTEDSCDLTTGNCINDGAPADGTVCDDGSACTDGDICADGVCGGEAIVCDDGNVCNGAETCDPAVGCVAGPAVACDDGNPCTLDSCDPADGCINDAAAADGLTCDDADACTDGDVCSDGTCGGGAIECDDGNACNGAEGCDPASGCVAGDAVVCDDLNVCTLDSCDPASGACDFDALAADGLGCDDGDASTVNDVCTGSVCAGEGCVPYLTEDFNSYAPGSDPTDWIDTGAFNSLAPADDFSAMNVGGGVLGTNSTDVNIHTHFGGAGSGAWADYMFTGRLQMENSRGGIGVNVLSDYPNSNAYYRLRRYSGFRELHLSSHGTAFLTCDNPHTGVNPTAGTWYRFKIEVEDAGIETLIRAKVWADGGSEPAGWQQECSDASPTRLTSGTVGVWSMGNGAKYWDDFVVTACPPVEPGDPCEGVICDDGNPCTADSCNPLTGECSFVPAEIALDSVRDLLGKLDLSLGGELVQQLQQMRSKAAAAGNAEVAMEAERLLRSLAPIQQDDDR